MATKLPEQDIREILDLYAWGAKMADICMLYGVHKLTVRTYARKHGLPSRPNGKPPIVSTKRPHTARSSRPTIPEGAALRSDDAPDVDQLIRACAHAQRDRRTGARQ